MTILNKPIKRELPGRFDRREQIVELHPWGVSFRAKRTRKSFPITWDSIFNRAMLIAAEEQRKARKAKKAGNQ